MDSHELLQLLDAVATGELSAADAALRIRTQPYVDTGGFAKVDIHRRVRCGFPEVIFGQGKSAGQIEAILRTLMEHEQGGLVTRRRSGGRGPSQVGLSLRESTTSWAGRSGFKVLRRPVPRWAAW